jgi:hypothetical protein
MKNEKSYDDLWSNYFNPTKKALENEVNKYYMNVDTGSVATYKNWKLESQIDLEHDDVWDVDDEIESGNLIEVKFDDNGNWIVVK